MKIIFLDIDGVLNHEDFYRNYSPKYRNEKRKELNDEWGESFCPNSSKLINQLILQTSSAVVISSTKRFIKGDLIYMNKMWKNRGFVGEIIGITPSLRFNNYTNSVPRGCEIKYYLEENLKFRHINYCKEKQLEFMQKSNVENYIIIDDDSDMLYQQRNHFVHVLPSPRNTSGFNELFFNIALEKLSKNIIELNY